MRFVPKVVLKSMTVAVVVYSGLAFATPNDMQTQKDKICIKRPTEKARIDGYFKKIKKNKR